MNEQSDVLAEDLSFWDKHRFLLLIALTVGIALVLVGISMTLYASSGTAQLDLSRPGYRSVSSQAVNTDSDFENYASSGQINKAALTEFNALYQKQAVKAKAVDAFSGDPLDPDVLEISAPTSTN